MRILISNDDGIRSHGLEVLERIALSISSDVWIVAPSEDQSGASHSLTLQRPLRLQKICEKKYSVSGTPTDCVLMALHHLMTDHLPDLILSGVNHGSNLADDINYSGTVAAASQGTLAGIRSIAFSLAYKEESPLQWETVEVHAPRLIEKLMGVIWPENVLMNVNFPDVSVDLVKGMQVVQQGTRNQEGKLIHRVDPRGKPYFWVAGSAVSGPEEEEEGTDLAAIRKGMISKELRALLPIV